MEAEEYYNKVQGYRPLLNALDPATSKDVIDAMQSFSESQNKELSEDRDKYKQMFNDVFYRERSLLNQKNQLQKELSSLKEKKEEILEEKNDSIFHLNSTVQQLQKEKEEMEKKLKRYDAKLQEFDCSYFDRGKRFGKCIQHCGSELCKKYY